MIQNVLRRILVVDDDAAMQKVLVLGLEKAGYVVRSARNGQEALDQLGVVEWEPDCILLDIRMPVMTGREALPEMRRRKPNIPVIMLTAYNDLTNGVDSMRDGAFDYLVKPIRLENLVKVVLNAMHHRDLLVENAELVRRNEEYRAMLEHKVESRTIELNEVYFRLRQTNLETVKVLAETIEAKDPYTRGHCQRVRMLAVSIAGVLGFSVSQIEMLEYPALLHDIGKIGIPETLLNKRTPLEPFEFEVIRMHPSIGAQILSHVEFFAPFLSAVLQHHERWDGRGYPGGLCGEEIDPLARIISVSDSFDAMASSRPYREALAMENAVREIEAGAGKQFAPEVVKAFLDGKVYEEYQLMET